MAKKKKVLKHRNPMVLPVKMKTGGGTHKNKKDKRAKENKNKDYTDEKNT